VIRAAWQHFLQEGYGRVVMTCSSTGLFALHAGVEGPGYFSFPLSPEAVGDHQDPVRRQGETVAIRGMVDGLDLTVECLVAAGAPQPPPTGALRLTPPLATNPESDRSAL
jgi:hypothetical protein